MLGRAGPSFALVTPSAAQVDEAISAQRGLRQLLRHGDLNRLDAEYRKSPSSFSFGANASVGIALLGELCSCEPQLHDRLPPVLYNAAIAARG
jgi:hypothetical protein